MKNNAFGIVGFIVSVAAICIAATGLVFSIIGCVYSKNAFYRR